MLPVSTPATRSCMARVTCRCADDPLWALLDAAGIIVVIAVVWLLAPLLR